jgi:ribonuclease E
VAATATAVIVKQTHAKELHDTSMISSERDTSNLASEVTMPSSMEDGQNLTPALASQATQNNAGAGLNNVASEVTSEATVMQMVPATTVAEVVASPKDEVPALPVQTSLDLTPVVPLEAAQANTLADEIVVVEKVEQIMEQTAIPGKTVSVEAAETITIPSTATPTPAAVTASVSTLKPAPMPVEDLQVMLASAGLVLATTDPEKHRLAAIATAAKPPVAHIARERKPLEALSTEPLVLIETKKS